MLIAHRHQPLTAGVASPEIHMTTQVNPSLRRVRTPWWRRLTALISLGSLVIISGITIAAVLATSAMLLLMFLERAAG
jgi:hypothetical protein